MEFLQQEDRRRLEPFKFFLHAHPNLTFEDVQYYVLVATLRQQGSRDHNRWMEYVRNGDDRAGRRGASASHFLTRAGRVEIDDPHARDAAIPRVFRPSKKLPRLHLPPPAGHLFGASLSTQIRQFVQPTTEPPPLAGRIGAADFARFGSR
jgi:hypothetical protein